MRAYGTHPQSQPAALRQLRLPLTDGSSSDGGDGAGRPAAVAAAEARAESGEGRDAIRGTAAAALRSGGRGR